MNDITVKKETEIASFSPYETKLIEFEKDYGTRVYDMSDPKQNSAARSDRLLVAKEQSAFQKIKKAAKASAQERVNFINGQGKKIDDRFEVVKQSVKSQIDKHETEIQERADALQSMVDDILFFGAVGDDETSAQIIGRMDDLEAFTIDDSFENRKADATLAKVDTLAALLEKMGRRTEQEKFEKAAEDLKKTEQEARERKIAQDAAEAATREAEDKATRERQEREKQAKIEAEAAERKAKEAKEAAERAAQEAAAKAERQVKEAEEKAAKAAKDERDKIQVELSNKAAKDEANRRAEEAKKADKKHRDNIVKEVRQSLVHEIPFLVPDHVDSIMAAIKGRLIEHVSINY